MQVLQSIDEKLEKRNEISKNNILEMKKLQERNQVKRGGSPLVPIRKVPKTLRGQSLKASVPDTHMSSKKPPLEEPL